MINLYLNLKNKLLSFKKGTKVKIVGDKGWADFTEGLFISKKFNAGVGEMQNYPAILIGNAVFAIKLEHIIT